MAPFATTKHLNIREQRESDGDRLFELVSDPRVQQMVNVDYLVPQGNKARKRLAEAPDSRLFVAVLEVRESAGGEATATPKADETSEERKRREDEVFVGTFTLFSTLPKDRDAMIGIAISPKWWGRGYGTESMEWLINYGFEQLGLHRVSLMVLEGNDRAINLYKKLGFVQEGIMRKKNWRAGRWWDVIAMGILEDEWTANKKSRE